ncbi:MAG: pyridoxal phosphate-dependent aminotransferase, partial [Myxococcaceae bacterium]
MPAQPTSRVRSLAPSPTVAVSEKARALKDQGVDVIDLGGGDPDFITPGFVREAATAAMNGGDTHYVNSAGTPALRQAIARKLKADNQLTVDAEEGIVVTPGGKASLFEAFLAYVEPGVDVLLPEPAWVSYRSMIELAGGRVASVPLDGQSGFALTTEALERALTPQSRVLVLNSPSNPTGHVMNAEELKLVAAFAKAHDLLVFSDEIYEKVIYDPHRHLSIASREDMAPRTLTFNGFSKAYAMTGWRLGYAAGPRELIGPLRKVHGHMVTCATSFVQAGGVAALEGPQASIGENVAAWERRRRFFCDGLNALPGVRCPRPEGAFYAFADMAQTGVTADRLLSEARVAATPGHAFGASGGGYLRFSFATSDEALHEAL